MKLTKYFFIVILACFGLWLVAWTDFGNTSGNLSDPLGLLCLMLSGVLVFSSSNHNINF